MIHTARRVLALAAVTGAVAAPTTAFAANPDPGTGSSEGAPTQATVAPATSSDDFSFGDAAIGAGALAVVLAVGGGATILVHRTQVAR
jgi:hypothetical protein